jgi:hypothetical protein
MLPRGCWHGRALDRASGCDRWLGTLPGKEANHMVPLLLWILGVPGLIILLLLILGIISF